MNREFQQCLRNKKITPFTGGKSLVGKEMEVAGSDLADAKISYEEGRYKWATIQSYYAMFHAARALIYDEGYREKSHYCLLIALQALFVEEAKMDAQSVRDFRHAMNLRQAADYEAEFSEAGAQAVIAAAERFIDAVSVILDKPPNGT